MKLSPQPWFDITQVIFCNFFFFRMESNEHSQLASNAATPEHYSTATTATPTSTGADNAAFGHESGESSARNQQSVRWWPIPKRYVVALMSFFGFGEH